MPAESKAQFKMMAAAEHNPQFAKKVGIKPSKAAEFVDATPSYGALPGKVGKKKVKGKKHIFAKHPVGGYNM